MTETPVYRTYAECKRHIERLVEPGPCRDKILALTEWMFGLGAGDPKIPAVKCYPTRKREDIRFFLRTPGKDHFALFQLQRRCTVLGVYTGSSPRRLPSFVAPHSTNRVWSLVKRVEFERTSLDELKSVVRGSYDTRLRELGLQSSAVPGTNDPGGTQAGPQSGSTPRRDPAIPSTIVEPAPPASVPAGTPESGNTIKQLFEAAEQMIADAARSRPVDDLVRQYEIIRTRRWPRVEREPDILVCLLIQAASYSVVRRTLGVVYPEDISRLDSVYGSHFFGVGAIPELDYAGWEQIVLDWGNRLLASAGRPPAGSLPSLVSAIGTAYGEGASDLSPKKPRTRLVLSLATALPVVRREILGDPGAFLDRLDELSSSDPGSAYDYATRLSREISGMANALVTNFLKELGLLYYVKVDIHLGGLIGDLTVGQKLSPRDQFIMSWLLAREAGMEPFFLDKILYVGGKYLKPQLRELFQARRQSYRRSIEKLLEELPRFRSGH